MTTKCPLLTIILVAVLGCSLPFAASAAQKKAPKRSAKSKAKPNQSTASASTITLPTPPPIAAAASNAPLVINGVTITLDQVASVAPLIKFHEYEKWLPCSFDYIAANSAMEERIWSVGLDDSGNEKLTSVTNWVVQAAPIQNQDFLLNRTNWVESRFTNNSGVFVQSYFLNIPDNSASFSRYGDPVKTAGELGLGDHWRYTGSSDEQGFRTLPKSDWRVETPMYVAVQVPTNGEYVDLTFEMVFAFNGPQCFRTDSFFGNDFDYYFTEFANHAGDIEAVRIRVDPTFKKILFVQTFAHGSEFAFMYPPGDIVFYPDATRSPAGEILQVEGSHPVIHSALHSHATYNPQYRSDRSREIFLASINLFDEKIGGDFEVWHAQVAALALSTTILGPLVLGLDLATVIISDNTKTRVCDIIGYGGVQWRPFENPSSQLVFVGLDTNGLPINGQSWSVFTGRVGDLNSIAPVDVHPIGDDSFSNSDQDRRAGLIEYVTKLAYDAGKLPDDKLHGDGPSGLGGRPEMQMSTPPLPLPHSIVYLQSGISPDFVLAAHDPNTVVIEPRRLNDANQLWEMRLYDRWGLAYINQGVGKAVGVYNGEPLVLVDPDALNWQSLWTLGSDEGLGYHAVRPVITDDINLNVAGDGPYVDGSGVIGYDGWGGGKINEVWRFYDPTNTVEVMLRNAIGTAPLALTIVSNGSPEAFTTAVDYQNVNDLRQRWIRKQRPMGWELRSATNGWYLFGSDAVNGQLMFLVPPYENNEDYRGRVFDIFSAIPGVGAETYFSIFGDNASDVDRFQREWERHTQWTTTPMSYGDNRDFFNIRLGIYDGYFPGVFASFFDSFFYDTPSMTLWGGSAAGDPAGLWVGGPDGDAEELWAIDLVIDGKIRGIRGATGPTIQCPPDITVTNDPGVCGAVVTFTVIATDPTFPSMTNAPIECTYPSGSLFPVGVTTNLCTVKDTFGNQSSCSFIVTVLDLEAPQIQAPESVTVGNDPGLCGAVVNFSITATDNCSATLIIDPPPGSFFPKGTNLVTCTATDPSTNVTIKTFPVIVNDIEPPAIQSVTPSQKSLWPPNHNMIPITVDVAATDNCAIESIKIVSVTSNESINGKGDGNTSPDWTVTGDLTLQLRAERSGTGDGRVYTITVEVTDTSENKSQKTTTVTVPKGNGH